MKIIGYTALHYGRDYLAYAIRSVIDYLDEYHVLYTPIGSHSHRTSVPCPETRDELYAIAQQAAGDKLRWHVGQWAHEGQQRDSIHQYAPDADVIVVLDADEIWSGDLLFLVLDGIGGRWPQDHLASRYRLPMIHYWRSMHRAILHDPALPERIILPKISGGHGGVEAFTAGGYPAVINHMGYAQRPEIIQYKLLTHGHRNEFRRDCDWFNDVFMANRQADCHPVGSDYWTPETVNPLDYMPGWMAEHPYYGLEVIE